MIVLEYYKILNFILILKLSQVVSTVSDNYKEQPEIKSDDGKLLIRAVSYRNITFRIKGDGGLFVNSMNILNLVKSKKDSHLRPIEEKEVALTTQRLRSLLESFKDDLRILGSRFAILQNRTRQTLNTRRSLGRIRQVLNRAAQIENNLIINECQEMGANGTRCKNGGNCFDGYKDFHCECPNGWTDCPCCRGHQVSNAIITVPLSLLAMRCNADGLRNHRAIAVRNERAPLARHTSTAVSANNAPQHQQQRNDS